MGHVHGRTLIDWSCSKALMAMPRPSRGAMWKTDLEGAGSTWNMQDAGARRKHGMQARDASTGRRRETQAPDAGAGRTFRRQWQT